MTETPYQRIGREQRERQVARAAKIETEHKAKIRDARKAARIEREARKERAYHDALVSDFNMDPGDDNDGG